MFDTPHGILNLTFGMTEWESAKTSLPTLLICHRNTQKKYKSQKSKPSRNTNHALTIWFVLNICNCAAVIGSANRNPPRSFSCPGVAQPSVVRDMRWLYVLHGAAHANWGLSIPPWGLKNQLVHKTQKCSTFQAKLGFSWLRVAKTRTPSICAKGSQSSF